MGTNKRYITNNEFSGTDLVWLRDSLGKLFINGCGIEIGALHKPLKISLDKCFVKYVDYKSYEENRVRYPELANEEIVTTDIVDDGFILKSVPDKTLDFIIANHTLEHSPDPHGTLVTWSNKLNKNGIIFIAVPIAEQCYDKGREITTLEHLKRDHRLFKQNLKQEIIEVTKSHIQEFIEISDNNIRIMNSMEPADEKSKNQLCSDLIDSLQDEFSHIDGYEELITAHVKRINRVYDIHYHTFTPISYEEFLINFCDENYCKLENVTKSGDVECIGIIRKL